MRPKQVLGEECIGCYVVIPFPVISWKQLPKKYNDNKPWKVSEKGYRFATKNGILLQAYTTSSLNRRDPWF